MPGVGWQLDGTPLVLDYDPRDASCALYGAWMLSGHDGPWGEEAIDHFLDVAMEYVEEHIEKYAPLTLL